MSVRSLWLRLHDTVPYDAVPGRREVAFFRETFFELVVDLVDLLDGVDLLFFQFDDRVSRRDVARGARQLT